MKTKLLYICLGISILINILIGIHIVRREPACTYTHLDEVDRTKDVIPDAEAAKKIAEVYLDNGGRFGLSKNIIYECYIIFNDPTYEWIVDFSPGDTCLDGGRTVWLRRDNGILSDASM